MSAFVVDKVHVDALVQAGLRGSYPLTWYWSNPTHSGQLDYLTADEVGAMLWAENVLSVQARYPDVLDPDGGEYPGPADFVDAEVFTYRFKGLGRPLSPVEALKALDCYTYQSCEHDGWKASQAYAFCDALRDTLIGELPGYAEAKWSINA